MNKPNIAVIMGSGIRTLPQDNIPGSIMLKNFLELLMPISEKIYTIIGNLPYQLPEGIQAIRIRGVGRRDWMPISAIRFLLVQLNICYNLYKISKGIDVVIFFVGTDLFVLPLLCAKLLRKRTVWLIAGAPSKTWEIGRFTFYIARITLEKIICPLADQIAVESPIGVDLLGLERFRKKTVVNCALYKDIELFKVDRNLSDRKNVVGYIGRMDRNKGITNFIQAMPLVLNRHNDLKFLIGGGGPLFNEIKEELKSNRLDESVELTGWLSHDEMPKYLNELKLLVVPSYSEGLPGIVQEAMACGTPVVATPVGCIPDLIKDGETGFIMEDNTPQCIAKNVIRALEYPKLDEIAQNARKLIEQEYSYGVMVEKCKHALDELMKGKG